MLTIEGDYTLFAHLETPYLGVLTRRSRIATNAREIVDAANGKEVLFFPTRYDHPQMQTGDGYAAYISGALGVSTDANAESFFDFTADIVALERDGAWTECHKAGRPECPNPRLSAVPK